MEADNNNVLEMAKTFDLPAFWELNLKENKTGQEKEIEFQSIDVPICDPESPAGKIWPNERVQHILQMSVKPITKEKAAAVKNEVERNFEKIKENALKKCVVINNTVPILKKEIGDLIATIDPAKLMSLAYGFMPDFSTYPENTIQTLAKVMFIQWAIKEMDTTETRENANKSAIEDQYLNRLPDVLKWSKGNNDLYLLFVELVERGFLDKKTEWRNIARWIKMVFDLEGTPEGIADEMSRVKSKKNSKPPQLTRYGKDIKNIFDEFEN